MPAWTARCLRIGLLLACARALLPPVLHAQQPDSVMPLPAIEVISSILPVGGPAVGSGVPARASVMDVGALERHQPRLLADALVGAPGVSLYDDLGSSYKPTVVIRGFTASPVVGLPQGLSVFIDGVPVNEPDAGQVNFDLLPLEHVARIEVLTGSAALLGPHTIGGAVNLVTRQGRGPLAGAIELSGGSYGRLGVSGNVGGSSGAWSYYVGGGHDREEGWRQLTEARRTQFFASIARLGSERGVRLQAHVAASNAATAGSLPLSVYGERPDSNLSAGDFEDLRQAQATLSAYTAVGDGRGSLRIFARANDAERFNVNQVNDPDVRAFAENRTLGAALDWRWSASHEATDVALRVGATGSLHATSVRIFAERIDAGLTTDVDAPIRDGGVYATAHATRGRVTLSGSGRLDVVRVPFRNRLNSARDTTSTFVRFSPQAGITIAATPQLGFYGSVGQSFRAPAVIELACADPQQPCPLPFALGDDPPLEPVIATTYEAGGRWNSRAVRVSAAVYRTDVHNDIFLFPYDDASEPEASTIDGYFANLEETRRSGLELGAGWHSSAGHQVSVAYAYTRAIFDVGGIELFSIREEAGRENEIEPGDRLPLFPDHTLTVSANAALPAGLHAGARVQWIGERPLRGDEANQEPPLPSFALLQLNVGWQLGDWAVRAVVDNVFDRSYAAFGTFNFNQGAGNTLERFLSPGEPRTFRVALRRELGE